MDQFAFSGALLNQGGVSISIQRVFSPSSTETYTTCPLKWKLSNVEHWRPKVMGKPGVAAMMGTAMAAGMEQYYKGSDITRLEDLLPSKAAIDTWDAEIDRHWSCGGTIEDQNLDRMPALLDRAIKYYAENDPIPTNWKIVGVEYPFPEFGYGRCDLIVDDRTGEYVPVDHKWKEKLYVKAGETKDQARNRTLLEYKDTWRMLQYVWSIRQHFQKPCTHYYIVLGELSPKPAITIQRFDVDEQLMKLFGVSALQHWADMSALVDGTRVYAMPASHESKYGPCEFKDACLEMGLDRARMKFKYVQVERHYNKGGSTASAI